MTEKEQIIKDFLDDWYDMEHFYEEHPELKNVTFRNIITFLNEVQLNEDDNISDVEHMFLHWIQGQYLYSKTKAEAIVSILQDFKDHYNQTDNNLNKNVNKNTVETELNSLLKYQVSNNHLDGEKMTKKCGAT